MFHTMANRLLPFKRKLASRARETLLTVLNRLVPWLVELRFRLMAEQGFFYTEERWEREDHDRYYREPDR